ncbi:MAG: DUF6473 family protein [Pseudomonadota bacterium]
MTFENMGPGALNYAPCQYGTSKLAFRGPKRKMEGPFAAFIGSTDTYGKFLEAPFVSRVEPLIDLECVNFGCVNAGTDVFLQDETVLAAAARARVTVLQAMGAHNMSNRLYSVHPRRNDRFVQASDKMQILFPEMDFTEFSFTKHLLHALKERASDRFELVVEELQEAWIARMRTLTENIKGDVVLLWIDPSDRPASDADESLGSEPLFVTKKMVDRVAPYFSEVVMMRPSAAAYHEGTRGMVFHPMDSLAAQSLLGGTAHQEIAERLAAILKDYTE